MTEPRPRIAFVSLAWLVIVGLVALAIWRNVQRSTQVSTTGDEMALLLQGRTQVGSALLGVAGTRTREQIDEQLQHGTYRKRLLATVLVQEFDDPKAARHAVEDLERLRTQQPTPYQPTADEEALRQALLRVYSLVPLEDEDQAALDSAGWLGRLAGSRRVGAGVEELAAVRNEAIRSTTALLIVIPLGIGAALVGSLLVVVFVYLVRRNRFRWQEPLASGSGLYAETFAVFLVALLSLGLASQRLRGFDPIVASSLVSLLAVILAIAWAVARGRDLATVRRELGLHTGAGVGREILAGLATWCAALPLVLTAALVLSALVGVGPSGSGDPFAPSNRPSHPVAGLILGSVWELLGLYWTAVVVAPLVEEIAFRGLLQTHLRGVFGRLTSGVLVGLLFAIVHPQGLFGVPVLLLLAVVFSLAREWRGSLIAPMVAHGLNNAGAITLLLLAAR